MSDPPSKPSGAPERFLPLPDLKREGYPWIDNDEHPLYAEQQAGWPNYSAIEAMTEAVRLSKSGAVADSRGHPAFDKGYIVNREASRPGDVPKAGAPGKEAPRR